MIENDDNWKKEWNGFGKEYFIVIELMVPCSLATLGIDEYVRQYTIHRNLIENSPFGMFLIDLYE